MVAQSLRMVEVAGILGHPGSARRPRGLGSGAVGAELFGDPFVERRGQEGIGRAERAEWREERGTAAALLAGHLLFAHQADDCHTVSIGKHLAES
jgi:hypothetical protein